MNLTEATKQLLQRAITFIGSSPWAGEYLVRLERLLGQMNEPCVLAVAGRVKAGKSTLINGLLGDDLALVGATETTATINYFRYGIPDDPARPVCCIWASGRRTWETRAFVDGLQGTDEQSLKKAASVSHLEFYLSHPDLKEVTLVDTPGTDALAGEDEQAHEEIVNRFFSGEERRELRDRHTEETRRLSDSADAVIYLVGQVAHVSNESFLSEFRAASSGQTRALNAIGVMSKVDVQDDIVEQRQELAASVASKLDKELNTVVPVSAALWQMVRKLEADESRLRDIQDTIRRIPESRFQRMLRDERAFLRDYDDCPVSVEKRKALIEKMPWRVWVLLARALFAQEHDAAIAELKAISGFEELHRLIHDHFFKRSRLLRCFRIINDLAVIVDEIQRTRLYDYRRDIQKAKKELIEFTDFIIAHPEGKSDTANRLRRYLEAHVPEDRAAELEEGTEEVADKLEEVRDQLGSINRQFHGLQLLEQAADDVFTPEEVAELQALFGLYAQESSQRDDVSQRQIYWRQAHMQSRDRLRKQVADQAVYFYGQRLAEEQEKGTS